ncbi:MAG TPA: hypothetical protein VNK46_03525 [Nitrospiraceae bacterium]|jgi:hypothetical protein|nr:hypothetical protein [Nitrospiraceae bacterium]
MKRVLLFGSAGVAWWWIVLSIAWTVPSLAASPVPIDVVLGNLDAFHLRKVTVKGAVREFHALPPYLGRAGPVYDACVFTLDDGTGVLPVHVARGCPRSDWPALNGKEGDEIQATLLVTIIKGRDRSTSYALAAEIKHLGP